MTSFLYVLFAFELIASQSLLCDGSRRAPTGSGDVTGAVDNVATIKSVLLNVLGLTMEPARVDVGDRREAVPDFMWQLYRRQLMADHGRALHLSSTGTAAAASGPGFEPRIDHSSRISRPETSPMYGGNTIRSFEAEKIALDGKNHDDDDDLSSFDDVPTESRDSKSRDLSGEDSPVLTSPDGASVRVVFNVSRALDDDVFYGAELRLCRHPGHSSRRHRRDVNETAPRSSKRFRISVYQVIKSSSSLSLSDETIRRLLDTKVVGSPSDSADADHWVSLDVSPAVATWKQHGHRANLGLDIETTTVDGRPIDVDRHIRVRRSTTNNNRDERRPTTDRSPRTSTTSRYPDPVTRRRQPQLVTYADDRRIAARKRKRSTPGARSKDRKSYSNRAPSCRRRPLYVDFAEVEWNDWIVAPVGYQAYVCSGVCPLILPEHLNSTNHAQIQSLLHSVNRAVPAPCCVPTELSPISLLYFDETGTVVLRNYQDMVVESCGCR